MAKISKNAKDKRQLIDRAYSHIFTTVILAAIVVSACIVAGKFLWDLRSYQTRVIGAQEETRDTLIKNLEVAKELEQSFRTLEQTDINSKVILDALPSKYDFPALSSSVEKIMAVSGNTLEVFGGDDESSSAVDSESNPAPKEIPFSISTRGTQRDLNSLIKVLENSIRPFRVDSLAIDGTSGTLGVDFSITTFYQPTRNLEISKKKVQ